ncbi:sugar ABC transporter permease [Amycolatopsis mediterranei S699]|uniref:Permease component of ABC-type sugar transport system n=2 Tax=Amycolatopsis mediterranei TaxID=33910 RepID=A0A0H3CWU1_AMYMU|nr:ABC transporter permease [Amycolatopsis mediterranei]ADJ43122.1 permease component of ABC-type sugar transport system [Amycolatopsis mediterranei U32]AEK39819.1 sugar ABC transporter permease [Amycolatopsis mediterranei S699]AFO74836.1 sugar ABC transporter permease [Amycolatopsis mediterranei S699]AGT81965.1 sugar ABC transporter permease [Amycolatopsis mediterranei RB]KDO05032.1 ATPase [Amycolatopsis mediterranei]
MSTATLERAKVTAWLQDYGVYLAVVVLLLFNVVFTENFLSAANFRTQLVQAAPVCIVALGMALVIGTEGIDLSVGSVMSIAAALIPLYLGAGSLTAIVVAVLAGIVSGLFSGYLVAYLGIQPIIATLALLVGGRGLALVIAHGQLVQLHNRDFLELGTGDVLGVPIMVIVAAVLAVLAGLVVQRTTFGRHLVAVGGNRAASTLAGLPVKRVLVGVYVISGALAAVAGVLATSRLAASDPNDLGLLMELSAITAVVVGGTPLSGGRVRVLGTVFGALLMQLVHATLIKHNLPDSTAQMVQAAIIVVAVYVARERSSR